MLIDQDYDKALEILMGLLQNASLPREVLADIEWLYAKLEEEGNNMNG